MLFITTFNLTNAQDGKPTKEETITFIKEYFNDPYFTSVGVDVPTAFKEIEERYKIISLSFINCKLDLVYENVPVYSYRPDVSSRKIIKRTFDMGEVEEIAIVRMGKSAPYFYSMEFIVKGKVRDNEIDLILGHYDSPDLFKSLKSNKIFKAFQHMRKLCGAPEPISFD